MSQEQNSPIMLGIFEFYDAKRVQKGLEKFGVESELRSNDETCTRGCKVTVEMWADEKDKDQIIHFLQSEGARDYDGLDINPSLLSQVFDPNADEVICQACGTKFSPKASECPDCGLVY